MWMVASTIASREVTVKVTLRFIIWPTHTSSSRGRFQRPGGPNQAVSASVSPAFVPSPTQAT